MLLIINDYYHLVFFSLSTHNIMSWFKDFIIKHKLFFRFNFLWFGEKGLGKPMNKYKEVKMEDIMKEIRKDDDKGGPI